MFAQAREARKRRWKPRYAMRKPEGYRIDAPGDLIQLDTVQIRFRNSQIRYQFSARDAICRWDCSRAFWRASSFTAAIFLEYMEKKFPFPVRAIQIDGGSEFKKHFEDGLPDKEDPACSWFPRDRPSCRGSPRDRIEHTGKSFMRSRRSRCRIEGHNRQLEEWNRVYNYIRPASIPEVPDSERVLSEMAKGA